LQLKKITSRGYGTSLLTGWRIFLCMIFLVSGNALYGQGTEVGSYSFLNVSANAKAAALGGVNVSLADDDVDFLTSNPALLGDTLSGFASASYQFYVGDIGYAGFAYAHDFNRLGTVGFGVQHLGYGTIKSFDETGQEIGDFNASATALVISKHHQVGNFRVGGNIKAAFSTISGFRSNALMMDLGGVFIHPKNDLTVGLVIKNAGILLSDYSETSESKLPFDVQLGLTIKPEHMPLRFSVTAYGLRELSDSNDAVEASSLGKVLRHFNFGGELLLHRNFNLMLGYNYRVHQELKLEQAGGMAGVSFGFLARIKTFEFVFSRSTYVVGTAGYGFTLSANVEKMITR